MFYRDLWSWLKTKNYFNFNFFLIWVVESSMIHVQLLRAWSTSCSLEMRRPCPASRTWTYSLSYIVWLTRWWSYFQCCGSGFRIQMESATLWIRINIPNMNPDPLQLSWIKILAKLKIPFLEPYIILQRCGSRTLVVFVIIRAICIFTKEFICSISSPAWRVWPRTPFRSFPCPSTTMLKSSGTQWQRSTEYWQS